MNTEMNTEIVSLNLADLEVTEIEHRFEMAVAMAAGTGTNGFCICKGCCVCKSLSCIRW